MRPLVGKMHYVGNGIRHEAELYEMQGVMQDVEATQYSSRLNLP